MTYNSKHSSRPKFNARTAAEYQESKTPSGLTLLFARDNPGWSQHKEDPEYSHVKKNETRAFKHYFEGCHHSCQPNCKGNTGCQSSCDNTCKGSYKDQGMAEPSDDAIHVLGAKRGFGGRWHQDRSRSKLGNSPTLADYMNIEVDNKAFKDSPGSAKRLKISDYLYRPETKIGFDDNGNELKAGNYYAGKSATPKFARAYQTLGNIHGMAVMAYHRLIGEGETNLKPYWDASKRLTHLAHGSKSEDGKWESIGEDHQPLNLHAELEGSLNTASHLTIPKHDALKPLHHLAKTAKFVKCFCPSCILDNHIHPASSTYDVQHHITAATSKDPALRDAYYHAYPVGYHERIGDRVSNLGPIGKRTPHRAYWLSGDAEKYVHHAVKHSQDEQHKLYSGVDVVIPFDVPKLDINLIAEQTSRGEFRPSWMDED